MLIHMPREYIEDESGRYTRVPFVFGLHVTELPEKHGGKIVWAVADGTAEDLADRVVDYREYDWSQADVLGFGHDEESLVHSGKIKDDHDLVTIPQTSVSMQMDQAMAIIIAHYTTVVPDEEREARVAGQLKRTQKRRRKWRNTWLENGRKRQLFKEQGYG